MATTFYQVVNNKLVQMKTNWRKVARLCRLNHLHLSGTKRCQRQSCSSVKNRSMQISSLLAAFNSLSMRKLQKSAWLKLTKRQSSSRFKNLQSLQQENNHQEHWTEFSLQAALMAAKTSLCTKPSASWCAKLLSLTWRPTLSSMNRDIMRLRRKKVLSRWQGTSRISQTSKRRSYANLMHYLRLFGTNLSTLEQLSMTRLREMNSKIHLQQTKLCWRVLLHNRKCIRKRTGLSSWGCSDSIHKDNSWWQPPNSTRSHSSCMPTSLRSWDDLPQPGKTSMVPAAGEAFPRTKSKTV